MDIKKAIVITSIFEPTAAVKLFAAMPNYSLYVAGDKKTPKQWHCDNAKFLSVEAQADMNTALGEVLPYNHYCRKMMGYIAAIQNGAEYIVDTDDDNLPKEDWVFPAHDNIYDALPANMGDINIYELYTDMNIWPRGLPLKFINTKFDLQAKLFSAEAKVGFWQGLADEDPDVDAIYRLTKDTPCYFNNRNPVVLQHGTICAFNSQNTQVRKELFPLLYLPTYVTFRYTDILRGLVAQPIMWAHGFSLGFTNATVVQKRNPHDYMKDFQSEIPMYETGALVVGIVQQAITQDKTVLQNLQEAYHALLQHGIVEKRELTTLHAWTADMNKLGIV
jgi:hypothetical protein